MTPADIKSIRISLGMSQSAFARAIGNVGRRAGRYIRRLEKGEVPIPQDIADKVRNLEPEEAA